MQRRGLMLIAVAMEVEAAPFRAAPVPDTELICTGIGLVNAATAVTAAILRLNPVGVVSAGSAGGLHPEVRVGEVVVATEARYGQADATGLGYAFGQIPQMPERYECDPTLVARAISVGSEMARVRSGLVVSSDSFVTNIAASRMRARFPAALAVDMETTAIAQVAYRYRLPFVSVRGISDLCEPDASANHETHVDDAALRSARVVLAMLSASG